MAEPPGSYESLNRTGRLTGAQRAAGNGLGLRLLSVHPAAGRRLWAWADRLITCEAPWVPVLDEALTVFVSARLGNYQESAEYGPLVNQTWVR